MYVKITNDQIRFPYTIKELRRENPNTSFPDQIPAALLAEFGVYKIANTTAPIVDNDTHRVRHATPELINNVWTEKWEVLQLPLEQASDNIRSKRDNLLKIHVDQINAVRWNVMTTEQQTAWTDYRQALLDIPNQTGFPYSVEWPEVPDLA